MSESVEDLQRLVHAYDRLAHALDRQCRAGFAHMKLSADGLRKANALRDRGQAKGAREMVAEVYRGLDEQIAIGLKDILWPDLSDIPDPPSKQNSATAEVLNFGAFADARKSAEPPVKE